MSTREELLIIQLWLYFTADVSWREMLCFFALQDVDKWPDPVVHYLCDFGSNYLNFCDLMFPINKKRCDKIFCIQL